MVRKKLNVLTMCLPNSVKNLSSSFLAGSRKKIKNGRPKMEYFIYFRSPQSSYLLPSIPPHSQMLLHVQAECICLSTIVSKSHNRQSCHWISARRLWKDHGIIAYSLSLPSELHSFPSKTRNLLSTEQQLSKQRNTVNSLINGHACLFFNPKILKIFTSVPPYMCL